MKSPYKILIAVGTVIAVGAGIYFAWWLFFAEPSPTTPLPIGTLPGNKEGVASTSTPPEAGVAFPIPRVISDHAAFNYWLAPEAGEVYYLTPEGYVYVVKEGPDLEIARQTITALNHAEPSSDGRRLLVSFGNPLSPQWAIFDTIDSVWRPLPPQIANAGWGRNSHELIASVKNGSDLNFSLVDITKTPFSYTLILRDLRIEDVILSTLESGDFLLAERSSANFVGRVWRVSSSTKSFGLALAPATGRVTKVERGEGVTYIASTESFVIADRELGNSFRPFFNNTLPEKCAASASTTYCFVPQNLPLKTKLPDNYYMHALYSADSLYSIAHGTGEIAPIFMGDATFDASHVRADKDAVYFIDRYTNKLYELEIGK